MENNLENLTKEELLEEVKKLQKFSIVSNSSNFIVSSLLFGERCRICKDSHSEAAGVCKACNEGYDKYKVICLVTLPNGDISTRTFKKYRKGPEDTSIIEEIGDEIDILRPYLGNNSLFNQTKEHERFCYPSILNEDNPCSCERIRRLDSFKKNDFMKPKDEVLLKMFKNWEIIFPLNNKRPNSFYDLKKEYHL